MFELSEEGHCGKVSFPFVILGHKLTGQVDAIQDISRFIGTSHAKIPACQLDAY
jgi:hypothetical protein